MSGPPLPEIAPVERMLIAVGMKAIISREVERFTKAKLAEMERVPAEVSKLARKLVKGELEPSFYSDLPHRQMLRELARGWDVEQVAEMVATFPREYQAVGSALVIKAKDIIDEMLRDYPISTYATATGQVSLQPPESKIFRFVSILDVVDNPLMVFSLMATGALLRSQTRAVRTIYPSLSQAMDAAILQATISAKAEKKSFELPPRAEVGVRSWFGKGPIPTKTMQRGQAAMADSKAKQGRPTPAAPPAQAQMTATQKTEAV